jgi:hypothetical protein
MDQDHQSEEVIDPEILNPPLGWEEVEEQKRRERAMEYLLAMTPAQRLQRHQDAANVAQRLERIAERYGIRAMGWLVDGPSKATVRRR